MKTQQHKITKVRAPKGFKFLIIKDEYQGVLETVYVYLLPKNAKYHQSFIGYINLARFSKTTFVTHSHLNENYWGRGLGVKLYARAIQWCLENGYKVRSSGNSSEMAQRVWRGRSIRKMFAIRMRNNCAWCGPEYDTWYAYPLKIKNGKRTVAKRRYSKSAR